MVTTSVNKELIKLRNLSSAFSRNAFVDVLNYNAYSHFNWLASKYDTLKCTTYFELLKKSYSLISKYYRCEYVYKNEGYVVNNPPAYITALGTQSSAATIPVTLEQTIKNGVHADLAGFVIPLCATIHLSGSTMKIVACSMTIMLMSGGELQLGQYAGFTMILGIAMVAAPGIPGGAIMAALGLLQSMLGFDETAQGWMITLYIAMDSFGTATNVTVAGDIAIIVNRVNK